jgi:hypothetical protein
VGGAGAKQANIQNIQGRRTETLNANRPIKRKGYPTEMKQDPANAPGRPAQRQEAQTPDSKVTTETKTGKVDKDEREMPKILNQKPNIHIPIGGLSQKP